MPAQSVLTLTWWRNITLMQVIRFIGEALAWAWAVVAGGGGFGLILTEGALPLTHGWYAMFSGFAWCPATAWLLKRYAKIEVPFLTRFLVALLIILLGRLALIVKIWPLG
ncbi:MAG: hypothetical protein ACTHLR_15750 [Rhizomicrobium sp.]